MSPAWPRTPTGAPATVITTHTVLFVVHSVTSANRLADLVGLFDSDMRIQLAFVTPDSATVPAGVGEWLHSVGGSALSWSDAMRRPWDLVITANASGNLQNITGPLILVSHGVGYTKIIN